MFNNPPPKSGLYEIMSKIIVGPDRLKMKIWPARVAYWIPKATNTHTHGPGSSVGIATDYALDGPGIESRWGREFLPVQTGPGAHPASCTMGTGSFPGVEAAGAWG